MKRLLKVGDRCGKLVLSKYLGLVDLQTSWESRCDCGGIRTLSRDEFVRRSYTTCGNCPATATRKGAGRPPKDITGLVVGNWTVETLLSEHPRRWLARCICGKTQDFFQAALLQGVDDIAESCGCLTTRVRDMPEWRIWSGMKDRTSNPKSPSYKNYGGRGILMCAEWRASFHRFLSDMGPRPEGTSIDRIDNDGNYEPGNCRWATVDEQQANKRNTLWVEFRGERRKLLDLVKEFGMDRKIVDKRLRYGWTLERALIEPLVSREDRWRGGIKKG